MPPRSAPLPGPAPVTKKVISGACGNCGAGAACCWASAADAANSDASAMTANVLRLVMELLPLIFLHVSMSSSVAIFRIARKRETAVCPAECEVVALCGSDQLRGFSRQHN